MVNESVERTKQRTIAQIYSHPFLQKFCSSMQGFLPYRSAESRYGNRCTELCSAPLSGRYAEGHHSQLLLMRQNTARVTTPDKSYEDVRTWEGTASRALLCSKSCKNHTGSCESSVEWAGLQPHFPTVPKLLPHCPLRAVIGVGCDPRGELWRRRVASLCVPQVAWRSIFF